MPRKPAVIPNYYLRVGISQDLYSRLALALWSDAEGAVPYGAFKEFFEARIREWFTRTRIDLAEICPGLPPGKHFATLDSDSADVLRHYAQAQRTEETIC